MNYPHVVPGDIVVHEGCRQWMRFYLDEKISLCEPTRPCAKENDLLFIITVVDRGVIEHRGYRYMWAYVLTSTGKTGWIHISGKRKL